MHVLRRMALPAWFGLLAGAAALGQTSGSAWTREDAAHLLRRAGFGGTPEQIEQFHKLGRQGAVNAILEYDNTRAAFEPPSILAYEPPPYFKEGPLTPEERQEVVRIRRQNNIAQFANMSEWWIRRMISTPRPLEEKLVLFWHGHFTSGMREVEVPTFLYQQNQLFRRYAKGSFRDLLRAVSVDPAMLRYLDNASNVAGHPNENFARELLELFTMGEGHYSENDIKSIARAFTGWTINRVTGLPVLEERQHDYGFKPLFGQFRRYNGPEVIEAILAQPSTARHLAREMWVYFAGVEPDPPALEALAGVFRRSHYDVEALLRAMFMSDAFYAPKVKHAAVKSPAELVAGTYRLLEIEPLNAAVLVGALRRMGQELFQPPNVKGWDGGIRWINTSSLLERYNFATAALYGAEAPRDAEEMNARMQAQQMQMKVEMPLARRDANLDQPPYDPRPILKKYELATPEAVVDHFIARLLQQPVREELRQTLISHLRAHVGPDTPWGSDAAASAVRGLIHLIISTPEYQVS